MATIESEIAGGVVDELEASQAPAAQPGTNAFHGGPGTSAGLNYSSGSSASGGGIVGQHEGGGGGDAPAGGRFRRPYRRRRGCRR